MDEDGSSRPTKRYLITATAAVFIASASILYAALPFGSAQIVHAATSPSTGDLAGFAEALSANFTIGATLTLLLLLSLSAFFSGSEVAFFSIHRVRARSMAEERGVFGPLVGNLLQHPGHLLTTILIANMVVNVLISVIMPLRVERTLHDAFALPPALSYILTIGLSTIVLVFFGEIMPKVFAVRVAEIYARGAAIPLKIADWVLAPAQWGAIRFTEFVFRVTRLNDIPPAPFITDEELLRAVSDSEAKGVIEQEEGQMIQGIIESGDAYVREILVPRPDVIAMDQNATVGEALKLLREHEFSRMPIYEENLDHIIGVLVAKDLLPCVVKGELDRPIGPFARRSNFVPETMTIREFVKDAQRKRMHMSIVVDEYGGTEGIATLEDAIEEVVGDIRDEEHEEPEPYTPLGKGVYIVDGGLSLDELSELIGVDLEDSDHETIAGFFIDQISKIPEKGDCLAHGAVQLTVEEVDGKRAAKIRVEIDQNADSEGVA